MKLAGQKDQEKQQRKPEASHIYRPMLSLVFGPATPMGIAELMRKFAELPTNDFHFSFT